MSKYKVIATNSCLGQQKMYLNTENGNLFQENMDTAEYVAYLAWVEEGNTPDVVGPDLAG